MTGSNYRYELRHGDEIIATGHVTWDHELNTGDEITIGSQRGIVDTVAVVLHTNEKRLVVRIRDRHSTPRDKR